MAAKLVVIDLEGREQFEALYQLENRSVSNQTVTLIKHFMENTRCEEM
ncbi:MAG: hypothetical protein ACK5QS_11285 [Pseudanabaenaceae cyanobacterium]